MTRFWQKQNPPASGNTTPSTEGASGRENQDQAAQESDILGNANQIQAAAPLLEVAGIEAAPELVKARLSQLNALMKVNPASVESLLAAANMQMAHERIAGELQIREGAVVYVVPSQGKPDGIGEGGSQKVGQTAPEKRNVRE